MLNASIATLKQAADSALPVAAVNEPAGPALQGISLGQPEDFFPGVLLVVDVVQSVSVFCGVRNRDTVKQSYVVDPLSQMGT